MRNIVALLLLFSFTGIVVLSSTAEEQGQLEINPIDSAGHKIVDSKTGETKGEITQAHPTISLPPGIYDVRFGGISWKGVSVESGKIRKLVPGTFRLIGASYDGHDILTPDQKRVGRVDAKTNWLLLPPGNYAVEVNRTKKWFDIKEGKTVQFLIEHILTEE